MKADLAISNEISSSAEGMHFWPGLLDLLTSVLMVFLLVTFMQTLLDVDDLEAIMVRNKQSRFLIMLRQEFGNELKSGRMAAEMHLDFIQVTFADQVLFQSGEYRLQSQGKSLLRRFAEFLAEAGSTGFEQVQVEGHTDNQPLRRTEYPADNWELSAARAIQVVRFLYEEGDLNAVVLSANGYANHRPVADNNSSQGRQRNRRIEVRLFFSALDPQQNQRRPN